MQSKLIKVAATIATITTWCTVGYMYHNRPVQVDDINTQLTDDLGK